VNECGKAIAKRFYGCYSWRLGDAVIARYRSFSEEHCMSRGLALGLVIVGVILLAVAVIEHFAVSTLIVPHLGIYLAVLGVILAGVGTWGLMSNRA
jgi:hypothetical protein